MTKCKCYNHGIHGLSSLMHLSIARYRGGGVEPLWIGSQMLSREAVPTTTWHPLHRGNVFPTPRLARLGERGRPHRPRQAQPSLETPRWHAPLQVTSPFFLSERLLGGGVGVLPRLLRGLRSVLGPDLWASVKPPAVRRALLRIRRDGATWSPTPLQARQGVSDRQVRLNPDAHIPGLLPPHLKLSVTLSAGGETPRWPQRPADGLWAAHPTVSGLLRPGPSDWTEPNSLDVVPRHGRAGRSVCLLVLRHPRLTCMELCQERGLLSEQYHGKLSRCRLLRTKPWPCWHPLWWRRAPSPSSTSKTNF